MIDSSASRRELLLGFPVALACAGLLACGSSTPDPYPACLEAQGEHLPPASLTLLLTGAVDGSLEPCG